IGLLTVECASIAGKLDELIADCDKAIAKAAESGASLKDVGRKTIAARLKLLALAEKQDAKFADLLPLFLKSTEPFDQPARARENGVTIDHAYLAVLRMCCKHDALRARAAEICESADSASRRIAENSRNRNYGWGRQSLRDNAWRMRLAEARFAAGDKDAGL